jgi:hypothetical protein
MLDYSLYINLTSNYTESTDYFQVDIENTVEFNEGMIDNMPVYRKEWGELIIKNKPYSYKSTLLNRYKLYDLILDNDPDTTFYVKFVYGDETIYGYFGQVDCKINEDRTLIKVKPAVIDQYTDFIENYSEKINIFGQKNLIKNGDFEIWTDSWPDGWISGINVQRKTLLDRTWAALGDYTFVLGPPDRYVFSQGRIQQNVSVLQGTTSLFEFLYALVGVADNRYNLEFCVKLSETLLSTPVYYLTLDGNWVVGNEIITYKDNKLPIPSSNMTDGAINKVSIVTQPAPISGVVTIEFYLREPNGYYYLDDDTAPYLYISDVGFASSDINYLSLTANLLNSTLVPKPQDQIIDVNAGHGVFFAVRVKKNDWDANYGIEDFFDEDGSPDEAMLSSKYGPNDGTYRYPGWIEIFEDDVNSKFYLGEISKLTIGMGGGFTEWFTEYRNIKGYAIFTREESFKEDEYDEEDNLVSPTGEGWASTDTVQSGKRLWVRKPFNGAYSGEEATWNLGDKITTPGQFMGFDYRHLITSEKEYPVNEDSKTISTGISFRDLCRKIYRSTHNSLLDKEVYSAFFWNDSAYLDELRVATGDNYVTRQPNKLNEIVAVHTTSLQTDVDQRSEDEVLEISFKDFFDDLKTKFPDLIWFMDTDKNLHIEHMKFIGLTEDFVNILGSEYSYVGDYASYEFNPEELYGTYEYKEVNSGYQDFVKSKITFPKIVTNKRNKDIRKEIAAKYLSTDIQYAIENPNSLENGIILVSYDVSGDDNVLRYAKGQITKTLVPNGDLSISTLLSTYGRYEGVWREGYINDELVYFSYTRKVKKGNPIKLKGIVSDNFFLTTLGIGTAQNKRLDYANEMTEITPIYRHYNHFLVMDTDDLIEI